MKIEHLADFEKQRPMVVDARDGSIVLLGDPWFDENEEENDFEYRLVDDLGVCFLASEEAHAAWLQRVARFCLGQHPLEAETQLADPRQLIDQIVSGDGAWEDAADMLKTMIHALYQERM